MVLTMCRAVMEGRGYGTQSDSMHTSRSEPPVARGVHRRVNKKGHGRLEPERMLGSPCWRSWQSKALEIRAAWGSHEHGRVSKYAIVI